ncbi:MAG: SDR family oxidoreductase [Alphaproteobacteria bacterium]|nr:MAG: SDR family oxidoreductase [Alphaproteobacteria bacterium]
MDLGLKGKAVIVMAGSQGLGLATARGFAREGARVTICARSADGLAKAAALIGDCLTVEADVTKADDIAGVIATAAQAHGDADVLVNNAGGPPPGAFQDLDDAAWAKAVDLTLMSAIRATRLVLPAMRAKGFGRIVNISSFGVKTPVPGLTLSNSIRMAVLGWAKTLANQVAKDGVTVNTVCPGWTRTDRVTSLLAARAKAEKRTPEAVEAEITATIPMGRMGTPEDVANMVVFLGSAAAGYVTGAAVQVDGGAVQAY